MAKRLLNQSILKFIDVDVMSCKPFLRPLGTIGREYTKGSTHIFSKFIIILSGPFVLTYYTICLCVSQFHIHNVTIVLIYLLSDRDTSGINFSTTSNPNTYQWRIQDLTLGAWSLSTEGGYKSLKVLKVEVKVILACLVIVLFKWRLKLIASE